MIHGRPSGTPHTWVLLKSPERRALPNRGSHDRL